MNSSGKPDNNGRTYDILCVGLLNANLPVKPVDKRVFDVDVTLVDEIEILPGGDAMNEAITLARLGNRVGLAGMVGRDSFADVVLKAAGDAGVDVSNVRISDSVKTSVAIMLIKEDGSRNFASYRGANSAFSIGDIDLSVVRKTRMINIGSMFALRSFDGGGATALLKEAKANDVITSADMKYDTYKIGFEGIRETLQYIDYFLPSYDEAAYLTNEKEPEKMAGKLLAAGTGTVVIKLGDQGCHISTGQESFALPPFKTKAVDTTGAGDNFVAGFLTGVGRGWNIRECGTFANAVGSLSVQFVGPSNGVRSMEQVLNYMESFKGES